MLIIIRQKVIHLRYCLVIKCCCFEKIKGKFSRKTGTGVLPRGEGEPGIGVGTPCKMAYTGRLFQASGNSDIRGLLVEVYEKVRIPVIAVCERTQKG